jgi:hypothetical protein
MNELQYAKKMRVGEREILVEGDKEYVEEEFKKLKDEVFSASSDHPIPQALRPADSIQGPIPSTLRDFVQGKKTDSNLDYLILVGYYLEKIVGMNVFTKDELERYARDNKIPLGKNLFRDLAGLEERKLIEAYGEKDGLDAFRLTMKGERFFQEELS